MQHVSRTSLIRNLPSLRDLPGFGKLAHSPGAERVGSTAVVLPSP
jgi:hypothetical protein